MLENEFNQVASFFDWWAGELQSLAPASWRQSAFQNALVIDAADVDQFTLKSPAGEVMARGGADVVLASLRTRGETASPLVLRLSRTMVLMREFSAPSNSLANLRQMAAFDLELETPFSNDEVCFDLEILELDPQKKTYRVRQAIVSNEVLDEVLSDFRQAGVRIDVINVAGAEALNLMRRGDRSAGKGRSWRRIALAGLALALVFVSIHVRQQRIVRDLSSEVAALEEATADVREAARNAHTGLGNAQRLNEAMNADTPVVPLLASITDMLDDDVWLDRLEIRGKDVSISGYAQSAAALITLLEASDGFENVSIRAPITQLAANGRERFELQFEVSTLQGDFDTPNAEPSL